MTYLQFLLLFVIPPLALLALMRPWKRVSEKAFSYLLLLACIALVYATPWDNYLVWRGAWTYDPARVAGVIGYVPVEEYCFFILQPLLTGCWLYFLIPRLAPVESRGRRGGVVPWAGALFYLALTALGVLSLTQARGTYLGLILVWAPPILAAQWGYAGNQILEHAKPALLGVLVPTLYLCVADAIAIRLGIWHISEAHSYGLKLFSLPIEEIVFFLLTNVLVVQGLVLFLASPAKSTRMAGGMMNEKANA